MTNDELGVTHAYRDVLMNFVCNMRRLGIYDHLLIAAFDEETYRFGFRMGLPMFYYESEVFLLLAELHAVQFRSVPLPFMYLLLVL
jgi:hypothetical protein